MKMTKKQYNNYVNSLCPKSPLWKDVCLAFLIGGGICTLGQLIQNAYGALGLEKEIAGMLTSVSLIFLSCLATGLSLYDDLAKLGGAGTLVPITGFANAIASPAIEFQAEGFILGVGAKMFTIAGPVLVYGISASVIYGLIVYLLSLL